MIIFLFFVLLLMVTVSTTRAALDPPTDFELKSLNGKLVRLSSFKGKAVLINFWASWCKPCQDEIPDLVALYKKYKGRGFEILGISLDKDQGKVAPFVKNYNMNYIILFGNAKLAQQWAIRGVPVSFFINREGKITEYFFGPRKIEAFEKEILEILP